MSSVRLITLDPGHFHAALVQKEMYAGVDPQVNVYAPLGADLTAHLNRIVGFNTRDKEPTTWQMEVHAGTDFLERMIREKPGNVVILSGRNQRKIDYIAGAVQAGLNVLADKPWIIVPEHLPKLEAVLDHAEKQRLVAFDIMTERFEITSIFQRELLNDRDTFGEIVPGTVEEPGVFMESVHYLMKLVAGAPLRRPAWFFDTRQQGEGLSDVGTHLVDLVTWLLFPEQAIDGKDVQVLAGERWPTTITREDFQKVTGEDRFPEALDPSIKSGRLEYFCNNRVSYCVRGVHVKLDVLWGWQAEPGTGDSHLAIFQGSQSRLEVRQGKDEKYIPELYVVPQKESDQANVKKALTAKVAQLQAKYPGLAVEEQAKRFCVRIPDAYRVGHEAHFADVTRQFLAYLKDPASVPAWEKPNMLAKYAVSTKGVALGQ